MFDIGFWELVILFGLGLMVLGPERMPKVAAQMGRWAGQARRMARNLTSQIRDEIEPIESSMQSVDKEMRKDFSEKRPDVGQKADRGSTPGVDPEPEDNADRAEKAAPQNSVDADDDTSQSERDEQA